MNICISSLLLNKLININVWMCIIAHIYICNYSCINFDFVLVMYSPRYLIFIFFSYYYIRESK